MSGREAVEFDDFESFKKYMTGCSIITDIFQMIVMHATQFNRANMIKWIMETYKETPIFEWLVHDNANRDNSMPLLSIAAQFGAYDVIRVLLPYTGVQDIAYNSPLTCAVLNNAYTSAHLLMDAGARLSNVHPAPVAKLERYYDYQDELDEKRRACKAASTAMLCVYKKRKVHKDFRVYIIKRYILSTKLNNKWIRVGC